jgi:hypothetical protein
MVIPMPESGPRPAMPRRPRMDQLNDLLGVSTASDPNWDSTTAPDIAGIANTP